MGSDGSVLREELEKRGDSHTEHINYNDVSFGICASCGTCRFVEQQ